MASDLRLDEHGFELHSRPSGFADFYDEAAVRERYYPEVQAVMRGITGAVAVIVFDHNVRSAARAARGEVGVRVDSENPLTGEKFHNVSAYLTFVALGSNGKPREVPQLVPETEVEKRRHRAALRRLASRIQLANELKAEAKPQGEGPG